MMPSTRPQESLNVVLKPVTSESDVPALALVNERALDSDPLKTWMRLYTENTEWDTTVRAVTEALTDPNYQLVKAVVPDPEDESGKSEKIVGFVHWMCGWIVLDKVDPFAEKPGRQTGEVEDVKDVASDAAENLASKAQGLQRISSVDREAAERAVRLKKGEAKYIETRNHYIAAIRGKKHIFIRRIMVLPEYQRKGIARKLMNIVTDEADKQKIVCWLFARPAGEKLYQSVGYKVVAVTEMDEEELTCPPSTAMMRLPQIPES